LHAEGDEIIAAILGIGIDVNCRAEELPADIATSLQIETGKPQDRVALAAEVLAALDHFYRADFEAVVAEWARLSTTLGRQLIITMGARRIEGYAQALDGDGALLLRRDNGQLERILGGDVTVEK
jgi:BirA family biotin operon repressor/biotin-[acetyl-CoA-carboxylase] ligase